MLTGRCQDFLKFLKMHLPYSFVQDEDKAENVLKSGNFLKSDISETCFKVASNILVLINL